MIIDNDTMVITRESVNAYSYYESSQIEIFNIESVEVPEDLHNVVFMKNYKMATLTSPVGEVNITPAQLHWLYMEAVNRHWFEGMVV